MTDTPATGAGGSDDVEEIEAPPSDTPLDPAPATATATAPSPPGDEKVMPLVDHLGELRKRVAISLLAVVIGASIGFILAPHIIKLLLTPLPEQEVVFLTLSGGFLVFMRIALVFGVLVALPVILYQLWAFVAPGLTPDERRAALPWIPLSVVFFLLGTLVAWITLPVRGPVPAGLPDRGSLEALPSAEAYFGFVTMIFLIFGLVMQFPIVLVFLSSLGILTVEQLKPAATLRAPRHRRLRGRGHARRRPDQPDRAWRARCTRSTSSRSSCWRDGVQALESEAAGVDGAGQA